jgi:hypothetical protein
MKIFITLLATTFIFVNYRSISTAEAQSQTIDARIRIAVCGDGVAEYPEECDNDDLAGETCHSQGYQPGTLQCDIACDLDTAECGPPLPTPTPSPTPTPGPTPTDTPGDESEQIQELEQISQPTDEQTVRESLEDLIRKQFRRLPDFLRHFDLNGDGRITLDEVFNSARLWAEATRRSNTNNPDCDLNGDGYCDLADFSILMYYVEN